uniref:Protein BCCIP homolog n=2 Tax=Clastoptera arizonana TaxID=38151 RepID=A0A1B6D985_9HEMI
MASPVKKRACKSNVDDPSVKNGLINYERENQEQIVEIEFEGRTPVDSDFNGIQTLLKQLFLKANVNLSDLTNLIIAQDEVGSVIKQSINDEDFEDSDNDDDDDDQNVFGITTVINFKEFKSKHCVQQLFSLLQTLSLEHGNQECQSLVRSLTSDRKTLVLLINERFVNISARIVAPLLETLRDEIAKKTKKNHNFKIDYYVMICKIYKLEDQSNNVRQNGKLTSKNETSIVWSNPEEELLDEEADCKFEFSVETDVDSGLSGQWMEDDDPLIPYRRVLFFSADKFDQIILRIMAATWKLK